MLAFYRQGIFQTGISELDIDYLTQDPSNIRLRWVNLGKASQQLLSNLIDIVRNFDQGSIHDQSASIDVARALVAIYDQLPRWVDRTQCLSDNAKRVRQMFKQANDPNKLIFDDIPKILSNQKGGDEEEIISRVARLIQEV